MNTRSSIYFYDIHVTVYYVVVCTTLHLINERSNGKFRRSQWPRRLRHGSAAARFEIMSSNPTRSMDVCLLWVLCFVRRSLCVWLITRPEESYRVWCVWVWSRSPVSQCHDMDSGRSATGEKSNTIFFNLYKGCITQTSKVNPSYCEDKHVICCYKHNEV